MANDENARIGYQAAVSLWTNEAQLIWARFNAMLVANSIVMAVIGVALTSEHPKPTLALVTAVAGFVLCVMWVPLTFRGFDYHKYWILSARQLEARLRPPVETVSRGRKFARGDVVDFGDGKHRLSCLGRLSIKLVSCASIVVFAGMYVAAFVFALIDIC